MEHVAADDPRVLIQIHSVGSSGRQISREAQVSELVESRSEDIKHGIRAGFHAVTDGLTNLTTPDGVVVSSIEVEFGLSLGIEGSVIVATASSQANFGVKIILDFPR